MQTGKQTIELYDIEVDFRKIANQTNSLYIYFFFSWYCTDSLYNRKHPENERYG